MEKRPTREDVRGWLSIVQSGLVGREYRDVFLKLPEILMAYLTQEAELDQLNSDLHYYKSVAENQTWLKLRFEADNQALKAKLEGTFRFETPKSGEPLPYHINEEDTLP